MSPYKSLIDFSIVKSFSISTSKKEEKEEEGREWEGGENENGLWCPFYYSL